MKKIILLLFIISYQISNGQIFSTNQKPVGWEHNILFNAQSRYKVTQQGSALDIPSLFDGRMYPSYTNQIVSPENPTVILIEDLPGYHTQTGAWVGWTTRYWPAKRFKIEGYDTYNSPNGWRVIADYSSADYYGYEFSTPISPSGIYTKLKFTFYTSETGMFLGVSELFFIHPEATYPYAGLLATTANNWDNNGTNLIYNNSGYVGIGTIVPDEKLTVKGKIHTQEVRVDMAGPLVPDYVFASDYKLKSLQEVDDYIKLNKHLPDIPSAKEIEKKGLMLAEMNMSLLKKMEEMTLYLIELKNENEKQNKKIVSLENKLKTKKNE